MSSDALHRRVFIDHVTLRVRDLVRSRAFYEAALEPLGVEVLEVGEEVVFGPEGAEDFALATGEPPSGPLHLAFLAAARDQVHAFHEAALAAGGTDNGAPGPRPQYHPGYYGAYVLDPDGNNVEAVFHDRSASVTAPRAQVPCEVRDVAPGLWIWRCEHPAWSPSSTWERAVTSTCVESHGEVLVLDALAPPEDARNVWERLNAKPPTVAVVLKPDHVRDVDLFVRRYACRAFGPWLFFRGDAPATELEYLEPGVELPGGLLALYDGRYRMETPLWLPEQRALVFADALTERDGRLLVWGSRSHEERVLPALRKLLELPFEHVIISHGEPVHDRRAFEHALELPPFEE